MIKRYSELEIGRSKPSQTILFTPPFVGPSGAKLLSYTWKWIWDVREDPIEGLVDVKKSDWENAEISDDTGKNIVHQFHVQLPNGDNKTISAESVPVLLGLVTPEQKKEFKSLGSSAKTYARLKVELLKMNAAEEQYNKDLLEVKKIPLPEITASSSIMENGSTKVTYSAGEISCFKYFHNPQPWMLLSANIPEDRISCLKDMWIQGHMAQNGWKSNPGTYRYQLEQKLKRAEKKLKTMTQGTQV